MFILPYRVDSLAKHGAWIVYSLIVLNSIIFLGTASLTHYVRDYGFVPARNEPLTYVTSLFLHADPMHLLGNMFFLWMFGESVEDACGRVLTLLCYLLCGICGNWLHRYSDPTSIIPCIGASGAISGIVAMYAVLYPKAKMDLIFYVWRIPLGTLRVGALGAVGTWIAEQVLLWMILEAIGAEVGIGYMAHIGGALAGAIASGVFVLLRVLARAFQKPNGTS